MYSQKLHEIGYSNKNDSCDSITAPHSIRQPWRMKTLTTTANKKAVLPQRYDNFINYAKSAARIKIAIATLIFYKPTDSIMPVWPFVVVVVVFVFVVVVVH